MTSTHPIKRQLFLHLIQSLTRCRWRDQENDSNERSEQTSEAKGTNVAGCSFFLWIHLDIPVCFAEICIVGTLIVCKGPLEIGLLPHFDFQQFLSFLSFFFYAVSSISFCRSALNWYLADGCFKTSSPWFFFQGFPWNAIVSADEFAGIEILWNSKLSMSDNIHTNLDACHQSHYL